MCGANNNYVNELEFGTGCSRFGVDNPVPTITKRLSIYGNTEDVESIFKQVSVKIAQNLGHQTDLDLYTPHRSRLGGKNEVQLDSTEIRSKDYKETKELIPKGAKK